MTMSIEMIGVERLAAYGAVPMVCDVRSVIVVEGLAAGAGKAELKEEAVAEPYLKDYDALEEGRPVNWGARFDLSHWGMWVAREGAEVIGGAAVARKTAELGLMREDVCVLWDLRVRATHRRRGVARGLVDEAARWALGKGCRRMMVETQHVNVAACRFYAGLGCELNAVDRLAYANQAEIAHEVMLVWCFRLGKGS